MSFQIEIQKSFLLSLYLLLFRATTQFSSFKAVDRYYRSAYQLTSSAISGDEFSTASIQYCPFFSKVSSRHLYENTTVYIIYSQYNIYVHNDIIIFFAYLINKVYNL